jgi:4-amino-4-deoxy-L-arabinose transferase-like glycosyltransferase
MIARLRSNPHWLVLGAILLLATALRFYKIDAQSLWYDEGNSARIAERSIQLIVEGAAGDIHPPLYYILLKFWRGIFGANEAGLRSFSVVCGVLTVVFAFLIGRRLFDARVGLVSACLLAIAPFAIYYAQEARMYALLALCAATSTLAILDFGFSMNKDAQSKIKHQTFNILLYGLTTSVGLWTQYAYPFVMVAQGIGVLLFAISDWRLTIGTRSIENRKSKIQNLFIYAIASIVALATYLPWLPIALRQIRAWGIERTSLDLSAALLDVYRTLIVGRTLPLDVAGVPIVLFSGFMLAGLLLGAQRTSRDAFTPRLVVLALAFLPIGLLFAFNLYRESYLKVLLVCVLPMCVLAARGIVAIGDWLATNISHTLSLATRRLPFAFTSVAVATLGWFTLPSLANLYDNPAYARDNYRGIYHLINQNPRADAAIVFIAPNQWEVYTYYQGNNRNLFPVPYKPQSYEVVAQQLERITKAHPRIFVLYYAERDADPEGWYEQWLGTNTFKASDTWIGNIRLVPYAAPSAWANELKSGAKFGDAIVLDEAKIGATTAMTNDVIPFELTWRTVANLSTRYKIFVHIGKENLAPIAQNDGEPVAGYRPTISWNPQEIIVDRRAVWITPEVTGDTYGVYVGIYDPTTGQRLPVSRNGQPQGDRLKIGEITIR